VRLSIPLLLVVAGLFVAGCRTSPASIPDGATPAQIKAIADAELESGNYATAARTYELLMDDYPRTAEADEAAWLVAEAWFLDDDLPLAQEFYKEFHENYRYRNLGTLGERMWEIGTTRYERGKSGIVGLGILRTSESGLEALTWITEKLHNGARADDAYFFVGKARLRAFDYDDAVLNFSQLIKDYPQSEWRYEARFLRGLANLKINRGAAYDRQSLHRARADFSEYVRIVERNETLRKEYPDRLEQARAYLVDIDALLAEKNLLIADFYRGRERYEAERLYLENASRKYPETEAGREAKARLESFGSDQE
jgi:outer membrane protein assembly factor BamD (BamD/ComL family)